MPHNDSKATEALESLVGLILSNNPEAGLYEQFANVGRGQEYSGAMKKAILVLHEQGALHGIEQKLGVKFPPGALASWAAEQPSPRDDFFGSSDVQHGQRSARPS
jgi:hypothetical protein